MSRLTDAVIDFECGNLDKWLMDFLHSYKVVHLRNVPYRKARLFKFYEDLFNQLGEAVPMDEDLASENKTGNKLIEIRYDPAFPNSYRHSDTRQPLHTDGSYESNAPDINFFFCQQKAQVGGATTFIDSRQLVKVIQIYNKDLFNKLIDVPVTFSKGKDSKTRPIIVEEKDDYKLTWNYFRVFKDPGFCLDFHNFLERKIVDGGQFFPVTLEVGEAVFFQDEWVLHGRNSFIGNRCLLKGGFKWKN